MIVPLTPEQMEILIRPKHIEFFISVRDVLPLDVRTKLIGLQTRVGKILHDPDSRGMNVLPPGLDETTALFGEICSVLGKHSQLIRLRRIMAEMDIPPPPMVSQSQAEAIVRASEFFNEIHPYLGEELKAQLDDMITLAGFAAAGSKPSPDQQLMGMDNAQLTMGKAAQVLGEVYAALTIPGDKRTLRGIMEEVGVVPSTAPQPDKRGGRSA